MRSPRDNSHRQSGFTLVEIMIALVVLSLISLGTLTAMRTLGDTQEKLEMTVERVDEMRQVSQFLRDSLRQAMLPPSSNTVGTGIWAEMGRVGREVLRHEPDELVWLAPMDNVGGLSGLNYLRLYRDRGDQALMLQIVPYSSDQESLDWGAQSAGHVLAEQVEELEIAYRMTPDDAWMSSLPEDDSDEIPDSIRITILARDRYWPDIIVSPDQGGVQ